MIQVDTLVRAPNDDCRTVRVDLDEELAYRRTSTFTRDREDESLDLFRFVQLLDESSKSDFNVHSSTEKDIEGYSSNLVHLRIEQNHLRQRGFATYMPRLASDRPLRTGETFVHSHR